MINSENAIKQIVEIHNITSTYQEKILTDLIKEHNKKTNSRRAQEILSNWNHWKKLFKIIVPPSEKNNLGIEEALEKIVL